MNNRQQNNGDFFTRYQNQNQNKNRGQSNQKKHWGNSKHKNRKGTNQRNSSCYKTNQNSQGNQKQKNGPYFSYTLLEEINNKDLNEIIDFFYSKDNHNIIESFKNTRFKDDLIMLMVLILRKISEANSEPALQIISNVISNTEFFTGNVMPFINDIKLDSQSYFECLNNVLVIFNKSFDKFGETHQLLPIPGIRAIVDTLNIAFQGGSLKFENDIWEIIKKNNEELTQKNALSLLSNIKNKKIINNNQKLEEVPIKYKTFPIEITNDDLQDTLLKPLQPHRESGHYESYERYLNTLFFLEYEDCYRSLRASIQNVEGTQKEDLYTVERDNRDIYYYINGEIINYEVSNQGILLTLDFQSLQRVIKFTKRMIYGSLLVLTDQSFTDFLLVTVHLNPYSMRNNNRDNKKIVLPKNKNVYRIKVAMVNLSKDSFRFFIRNRNKRLQIFESKAYFESYIHVMKRLQTMNEKQLPFEDVIIQSNFKNMTPPYLRNTQLTYDKNIWFSYNVCNYPQYFHQNLDPSQFKAMDLALHSKVALIQGPPGTGKTHLASILTRILINSTRSPILVVCFTNHALDQFLSHFLDFTNSIVRIGGRCNDERLLPFQLKNYHQTREANRKQRIAIDKELKILGASIMGILEGMGKSKPPSSNEVRQYFKNFYDKIITDFFVVMKFNSQQRRKFNHLQDLIYKAWIGEVKVEDYLTKFIGEKNQNYLTYWHAFDPYYDETSNYGEIPKELMYDNLEAPIPPSTEIYQYGEDEEEEEEDDEEELKENENRLALRDSDSDSEDKEDDLDKQETINVSKIEHLTDVQINYLLQNYNLWKMGPKIRKKMIEYLKYKLLGYRNEDFDELKRYSELIKKKKELEMINQSNIIRSMEIVGMTTTGCAKYSTILEQNNFEIIIVEEAAEILESHIAAILTKNTKHLIMIGDHKQLRPRPYNYEIEKKYHFDISMFERLINNKIPFSSLQYQRRMRPIFADFVRVIYGQSTYIDHDSIKRKENVKGFLNNMYFITHSQKEADNKNLSSKSNEYEANYVICLAKYLKLQGYKEEQITIVTLYIGQVLLIKNIAKRHNLNVRITSVDNYQGEENDFILLSLVRSNDKKEIGFLKTFNRVCVAFSRAKLGFYIIGNIDCIVEGEKKYNQKVNIQMNEEEKKMSGIWRQIKQKAIEKNIIGSILSLCCQNHNNITEIKTYHDFSLIPEGGCQSKCLQRMKCGHVCERACHNYSHDKIKCLKKCERILYCGHRCTKKCCEECAPCQQKVIKILPCGHSFKCLCSEDINTIRCKEPCNRILKCGHNCRLYCWEMCESCQCEVLITKRLLCGHYGNYPCSKRIEEIICSQPCGGILPCGHPCQGTCGDCLEKTLHVPCLHPCEKELICGHVCHEACNQECVCSQKCMNVCPHGYCGLKCCEKCIDCIEKCDNGCKHRKCLKLCSEQCDIPKCNIRCDKLLKCKHQCIGLCGERCPKVCRICDPNNECFNIFFGTEDDPFSLFYECGCGHAFEYTALDTYFESDKTISMTKCPRCKSILSNEKRYSNIIKSKFIDIQKVKQVLLNRQGNEEYKAKSKAIVNKLKNDFTYNRLRDTYNTIPDLKNNIPICMNLVNNFNEQSIEASYITTYKILNLLDYFAVIEYHWSSIKDGLLKGQMDCLFILNCLKVSKYFQNFTKFTEDFYKALEIKILNLFFYARLRNSFFKSNFINDINSNSRWVVGLMQTNFCIKDIKNKVRDIAFKETVTILKGLGTKWYKCPNGHLYVVGECGGPMQTSVCPDCHCIIGGQSHIPAQGNNAINQFSLAMFYQ